jgi:hypothetical protein
MPHGQRDGFEVQSDINSERKTGWPTETCKVIVNYIKLWKQYYEIKRFEKQCKEACSEKH